MTQIWILVIFLNNNLSTYTYIIDWKVCDAESYYYDRKLNLIGFFINEIFQVLHAFAISTIFTFRRAITRVFISTALTMSDSN